MTCKFLALLSGLPALLCAQMPEEPVKVKEADGIAGRVEIKTRPIPKQALGTLRAVGGEVDRTGRRAYELSGG